MIQRRHGASLALKTLTELGLGNLDRDDTIEARVAGLVHFAHATRTDGCEDFVRAEFVAGREKRHLGDRAKFSRSGSGQVLNYGALVHYFFELAFGVESRFRRKVVGGWTTMRELSVNAAPLIAEYAFKQACPRDVEM